jgi:hypothetical protein
MGTRHRQPVLALAACTVLAACGGARRGDAVWTMPAMQTDRDLAGDGTPYPFVYTHAGVDGADAPGHEDPLPRGDLPESMLPVPGRYWMRDERLALREARATGRGVLVVFHADWSAECRRLDDDTLSDLAVRDAIRKRYVPLRIDVTEETKLNRRQLERYRVLTLPAIVRLDARGVEHDRITAHLAPDAMLERLEGRAALADPPASRDGDKNARTR